MKISKNVKILEICFLATATCLRKTGKETGLTAQNLDRSLDRFFFKFQTRKQNRVKLEETGPVLVYLDRTGSQVPVMLENLSPVLNSVPLSCLK